MSHVFYADCAIFARVAETLNFQHAGRSLGLSRSSVSKHVLALEQALGVVLLNRSTRRMSVTDSGRTLLLHWRQIERTAAESFDAVHGSDLTPSGYLRLSMPSSLGALLQPSIVTAFMAQWPDIRVSLHLSEALVDIVGSGFDAVIRIAERLSDSTLTATRLTTTRRIFAASPGYLEKHGRPTLATDLKRHRIVALGVGLEPIVSWRYMTDGSAHDVELNPNFLANSDLSVVLAACLDAGVVYLPEMLIQDEIDRGRLSRIDLEDAAGPELGVFALYPHRNPPAKVKVFIDFVKSEIADLGTADRWQPLKQR